MSSASDDEFNQALNDLHDKHGELVEPFTGKGRMIEYKLGEEKCEVAGYLLKDGGVVWAFHRGGRVYPLRLSGQGMDAMLRVWHDLTLGEDP